MYLKDQFVALEIMCRERAELAKKEMEYWLGEAEEWKRLSESSEPLVEGSVFSTEGLTRSNNQ
jgi:hypothetical protein